MGNRYISIELNFLDKEAFYSLFKTISGITEVQKREIVDSLFQALDISRRNRLVRYRNG